jgi:hypothetical protein
MGSRRVVLGGWEKPRVDGCTVLTPNENAAGNLGVAPLSLEALEKARRGKYHCRSSPYHL